MGANDFLSKTPTAMLRSTTFLFAQIQPGTCSAKTITPSTSAVNRVK
jgi:hypothetical protein